MMKKFIGTVCAMALVAGMSLTAFAMPSPQGGNIEAFDAQGNKIEIVKIEESEVTGSTECDHGADCPGVIEIVTPATKEYKDEIAAIDLAALIKGTKYEGKEWVKVFEMEVIIKGCIKDQLPITLTFDADDWVEGDPLVVHYSTEKNAWELVEVNEANGKFQATFTSFSPLVFYVEKGAAGTTSPSTGDPLSLAAVAVVAGATGLAVVSRKKRA